VSGILQPLAKSVSYFARSKFLVEPCRVWVSEIRSIVGANVTSIPACRDTLRNGTRSMLSTIIKSITTKTPIQSQE
jgi:hypothetical protein